MKAFAIALVACLGIAGCRSTGPSQEQANVIVERGQARTAMRDAGKISWGQWARESNADMRSTFPNMSLRTQAALQYREAVAAEVDAGRTTKETANYLMAQKLAEAKSEDDRDASLRRASAPRGPIVCNRVGTATICD